MSSDFQSNLDYCDKMFLQINEINKRANKGGLSIRLKIINNTITTIRENFQKELSANKEISDKIENMANQIKAIAIQTGPDILAPPTGDLLAKCSKIKPFPRSSDWDINESIIKFVYDNFNGDFEAGIQCLINSKCFTPNQIAKVHWLDLFELNYFHHCLYTGTREEMGCRVIRRLIYNCSTPDSLQELNTTFNTRPDKVLGHVNLENTFSVSKRLRARQEACALQRVAKKILVQDPKILSSIVYSTTSMPRELIHMIMEYSNPKDPNDLVRTCFELEPRLLPTLSADFCCLNFNRGMAENLLRHCPRGTYLLILSQNTDFELITTKRGDGKLAIHLITLKLNNFEVTDETGRVEECTSLITYVETCHKRTNGDQFIVPWSREIPYYSKIQQQRTQYEFYVSDSSQQNCLTMRTNTISLNVRLIPDQNSPYFRVPDANEIWNFDRLKKYHNLKPLIDYSLCPDK